MTSCLQGDTSSNDSVAKNLELYLSAGGIEFFVKASVLPPHRHPEQSPIKNGK